LAAVEIRIAREQHERFDLGMPSRGLDGVLHAATGATDTDGVALHSGLGLQVVEGGIDVARPFFGLHLRGLLGWEFVETFSAAFSVAAIIEGKHVDAGDRELLGKTVPNFTLAVALMQKQNAGARLGSGEECRLQPGAVGGGEVDRMFGGEGWERAQSCEQQ
jgi:hypothetical protein